MDQPSHHSSRIRCIHAHNRNRAMIVLVLAATVLINVPPAESGPPSVEIDAFLERFHGHTCAGSLMGLRLGLAAKEALKATGKLKAKTFLLACPVDGIQVSTGATYGNKALEVEDRNELILILTEVESGRRVEAGLTEGALDKGRSFRELSRKARSYPTGSPEQVRFKNEIDAILDWFRTAPDSEVVTIRTLK